MCPSATDGPVSDVENGGTTSSQPSYSSRFCRQNSVARLTPSTLAASDAVNPCSTHRYRRRKWTPNSSRIRNGFHKRQKWDNGGTTEWAYPERALPQSSMRQKGRKGEPPCRTGVTPLQWTVPHLGSEHRPCAGYAAAGDADDESDGGAVGVRPGALDAATGGGQGGGGDGDGPGGGLDSAPAATAGQRQQREVPEEGRSVSGNLVVHVESFWSLASRESNAAGLRPTERAHPAMKGVTRWEHGAMPGCSGDFLAGRWSVWTGGGPAHRKTGGGQRWKE